MKIYAPTGIAGAPPAATAPSPTALAGLRIGVLDNGKPNAGLLMARVAQRLAERTNAVVTLSERKNAALACEDQVLDRLTKEVELVITGSAD